MAHKAPIASRPIKPRKLCQKPYLPIVTYTPDAIYRERDDTWLPPKDIFALTLTELPFLLVAQGVAALLGDLHKRFRLHPDWQFCCTPIQQEKWSSNQQRTHVKTHDTLVTFFGFRGKRLDDGPRGGKRHEPNRYHSTLDPITFARRGIQEIGATGDTANDALYMWAVDVRRFCREHGLTLRPTNGSLAAQFLRCPKFYPHPRRKVPAATNASAREHLPGNHYRLHVPEEKPMDAYYMDQTASHHNCAKDITFPHANQLYALGRFRTNRSSGNGLPRRILDAHGLFFGRVEVPHIPANRYPPPWAEHQGIHTAFFYSNELETAKELGIHIESIFAAWVSPIPDYGPNRYARWALQELKREPHTRVWKKPLLLSTYGILAATPRQHRVGFAKANGGTPALYPAGAGFLQVLERAAEKPSEPAYANVIHRGMIEAETRLRSLRLAREMSSQGFTVIAVYADSIFVQNRTIEDSTIPLPLTPPGWTVEACLTRLRFHDPVSFTSDQLQKLPGIPTRNTVLRASFGTRNARQAATIGG